MGQWLYFIHAPREDFAATMSEDEKAVFAAHCGCSGCTPRAR